MTWLPESATYNTVAADPTLLTATPCGLLKRARLPTPSTWPDAVLPTSVPTYWAPQGDDTARRRRRSRRREAAAAARTNGGDKQRRLPDDCTLRLPPNARRWPIPAQSACHSALGLDEDPFEQFEPGPSQPWNCSPGRRWRVSVCPLDGRTTRPTRSAQLPQTAASCRRGPLACSPSPRAASDATLDKRRLRATAGGLTTHAMS